MNSNIWLGGGEGILLFVTISQGYGSIEDGYTFTKSLSI